MATSVKFSDFSQTTVTDTTELVGFDGADNIRMVAKDINKDELAAIEARADAMETEIQGKQPRGDYLTDADLAGKQDTLTPEQISAFTAQYDDTELRAEVDLNTAKKPYDDTQVNANKDAIADLQFADSVLESRVSANEVNITISQDHIASLESRQATYDDNAKRLAFDSVTDPSNEIDVITVMGIEIWRRFPDFYAMLDGVKYTDFDEFQAAGQLVSSRRAELFGKMLDDEGKEIEEAGNQFNSMTTLVSLLLPDGFGRAQVNASGQFYAMHALPRLVLPAEFGQVQANGYGQFYDMQSLISLTLPEGFGAAQTNGMKQFEGMTSLTSLYLPDGFGAQQFVALDQFKGMTNCANISIDTVTATNDLIMESLTENGFTVESGKLTIRALDA